MEFRILGPLEVWEGGRPVTLSGAKLRALLGILLMHANRVVASDRLIDLLWGESPSDTVANTLQVCVSKLRRNLEPGHVHGTPHQVVVGQAPGYLIRIDREQLDLTQFERRVGEARQAMADGDPETAAARLRDGLALWRGPALADLAREPFAVAEAKRLDEMRLNAIEDRIQADLALGRHADLVGEVEALVAEHPLRERLRALLMLALYRSGRQAEASDLFHKTRAALVEELGMEPGPELQKLFKAILNQDPSLHLAAPTAPPPARMNNLPLQLTSFVGRIAEAADIKRVLFQARLLTLIGPGGVGKTRLAIQVASEIAEESGEVAWLIELASLTEASLVPHSLADSLGLREQAGVPIMDTITFYLERRRALLVLDNCEHLIEASAALVDKLLRACPGVRVLATSREPLRVPGEMVWRVPTLSIPLETDRESVQELASSEAVRLFCERAAGRSASFRTSKETLALAAEICRRVDGIPLAIELAAARLTVLSLEQILARLDDRFRILKGGDRTVQRRHQTLEAAIDWSYVLLSAEERALLSRLSVFAGGFDLDAVEAVCVGGPIEFGTILETLGNLVDKSLVVAVTSVFESRYRILETIRQYAQDRLTDSGEDASSRERHLDWYTSVAEQAEPELRGPNQRDWLKRLEAEADNLRAALEWGCLTRGDKGVRLANALTGFWMRRSDFTEGRQWLKRAVDASPAPSQAKAEALVNAGWLSRYQGDHLSALALVTESLKLYEQFDDRDGLGVALMVQGASRIEEGHISEGFAIAERSVAILRQGANQWALASALNNLGLAGHDGGDWSSLPGSRLEESLGIARVTGDQRLIAAVVGSLGQVAFDTGNFEAAWSHFSEAASLALGLGDKREGAYCLDTFGRLAVIQGHNEIALRLFAAAARIRSDAGIRSIPIEQRPVEASIAKARQAVLTVEADAAWFDGERMSMQAALEFAIVQTNLTQSPVQVG